MKKLLLFSFFFFVTTLGLSQTLGLSGSILNYNSRRNIGYGINLEYNLGVSANTDITFSTSILLANRKDAGYDLAYLQIPVIAGARYYITRNIFSPYIALEIGASYSKVERIEAVRFNLPASTEEHQELVRYSNVNFGFGAMIGTLINISKEIDLNVSARQYNVVNMPSSFITVNVGVVYNIM